MQWKGEVLVLPIFMQITSPSQVFSMYLPQSDWSRTWVRGTQLPLYLCLFVVPGSNLKRSVEQCRQQISCIKLGFVNNTFPSNNIPASKYALPSFFVLLAKALQMVLVSSFGLQMCKTAFLSINYPVRLIFVFSCFHS